MKSSQVSSKLCNPRIWNKLTFFVILELVAKQEEKRSSALGRANETMQQRFRKQKKWHELLEKPTVPSIPPKDKQVPQGEDEENAVSSGNEEDFMQKKEQVI